MLSKSFQRELFNIIDTRTNYREEEFQIEQNNESYELSLVYNKSYFFKIEKKYRGEILYTCCPGNFLDVEEKTNNLSSEKYINEVLEWLIRIDQLYLDDAKIRVINRKVELQKEQLENIIKKIDEMPNNTFSQEETANIIERLEKLENDLKENNRSIQDETSELKDELYKIQQEVEFLKNTINSMNKKSWLKILAIKLFNWTKKAENRQLLAAGIDVAREILPEVKEMIN